MSVLGCLLILTIHACGWTASRTCGSIAGWMISRFTLAGGLRLPSIIRLRLWLLTIHACGWTASAKVHRKRSTPSQNHLQFTFKHNDVCDSYFVYGENSPSYYRIHTTSLARTAAENLRANGSHGDGSCLHPFVAVDEKGYLYSFV